jgi:hypothetical protein
MVNNHPDTNSTTHCRTLSQLMGALSDLLGGGGSVGEEQLRQIGATPEERKILEDYARALGPMPYTPPGDHNG